MLLHVDTDALLEDLFVPAITQLPSQSTLTGQQYTKSLGTSMAGKATVIQCLIAVPGRGTIQSWQDD